MNIKNKYLLLKTQGIITLTFLLGFACWSTFQEAAWLYFGIIFVIGIIQFYIFIKFWQPILSEYLELEQKNET